MTHSVVFTASESVVVSEEDPEDVVRGVGLSAESEGLRSEAEVSRPESEESTAEPSLEGDSAAAPVLVGELPER